MFLEKWPLVCLLDFFPLFAPVQFQVWLAVYIFKFHSSVEYFCVASL
jgi:hypothetical protein